MIHLKFDFNQIIILKKLDFSNFVECKKEDFAI